LRTIGIIAIGLLLFVAADFGSAHAQGGVVTATVRPNPLKVSVSAQSSVTVGQWFDISADVTNLGDLTITSTVATISSSTELTVKGPKKKIGNLAGGQTKTVTWRAKANNSGTFIIQVEATGNLADEQISSSDSLNISAVASLSHFLLRLIFNV